MEKGDGARKIKDENTALFKEVANDETKCHEYF
jgi:hypothetical protein